MQGLPTLICANVSMPDPSLAQPQ